MPKILQFRRGTTNEISAITGAVGELFVDTTKDTVVVMDGVTAGGKPLATESYVSTQISSLIDSAPSALNTLNELAAALNNDASFASTITTQLSGKQATLVSGSNIKTVGGNSLLGAGNIALFSGSYTDLTNKPTIPTVPTNLSSFVNDSGYITSASLTWSNISGKPVLFSGSYNDLTNKPTIPTVPTYVSAFTNDSGYITSAALSNKQDVLISGSNIKTINGTSLLGSGNLTLSGGGSLDTSAFATKVDLLILDSDDIEEGLTNQYYNDSKVTSLFVHQNHTNISFIYEDGVIKATSQGGGGGGIVAPTEASYQPLATSVSTEFVPQQTINLDNQWNYTNNTWIIDQTKYAYRYMYPQWMNWIADNYSYWLPNPDNLTLADLRTKFKNKNYLLIGNQYQSDISNTQLAQLQVGDTIQIKMRAINTNWQIDTFTATTKITVAPFKFNEIYAYYDNFYDEANSYNFLQAGSYNKFYALAFDWIKGTDFSVGETTGLPIYVEWMFAGSNDGNYYSSTNYYGDRGWDSTARYLQWNYIGRDRTNVGYGDMGLYDMNATIQPKYVAQFNANDWPNVVMYKDYLVYGNALPYTSTSITPVVDNAATYKLKIGNTNLGLSNTTVFKKYVGIGNDTPIVSIGNTVGYENAINKTLAFTGTLSKRTATGSTDNYLTVSQFTAATPSWISTVTDTAKTYGSSNGVITTTNTGSFQVRQLGLNEVAQISPYFNQVINFDVNTDATLPTAGIISNPTGTYNYGGAKFNGGIYVKKSIIADNLKTNQITALTGLNTTNVSISASKIKVAATGDTPGDQYYNNTAVIVKPTLNDYNTGTFNNYAYLGGTVTKTGSTLAISNVIPTGATGYSVYIPGGSASSYNLQFQNGSAVNIGTGDFTVEGWFKQDNPYSRVPILRTGSSATDTSQRDVYYEWPFYLYDKHNGSQLVSGNGVEFMPQNSTTWVHYAYVRSGNTYKFYVNGTQQPNINGNNSSDYNYSSYPFWLYGTSYNTYVYNYRITVGVARYTQSFIPALTMATSPNDVIGTTVSDAISVNGGLKIGNSNSIPSDTNPTGGYLFVDGGALKYKGSNGTVTTIGAA